MAVSTETANDLMVVFSEQVSAGFEALSGPVDSVFGTMIVLVVALTGMQWALSPNRELLAGGVGKILLIGTFAWLINDWQGLSETLYAGFIDLGLTAGGGSLSREEFLNPGAVLEAGWRIVRAMGEIETHVTSPLDVAGNLTDALILGLAMIGAMIAFAVLALQIIVVVLEFKIVTLGGFVLLPFGIWTKSAFLAERPLGYVVSAGLKVLALAIVVSGAQSVFDRLLPSEDPDIYEALAILAAALLLAMLAVFIPNLAASLITGGPALGAGALVTSGLAVAGGGALAAGAAVSAGARFGSGAAAMTRAARTAAGASARRRPPPPGPAGPRGPTGSPPAGTGGRSLHAPAEASSPSPSASTASREADAAPAEEAV
ncbi:P-type conjugative transfer protein TrbL, partial [Phenylobacterium sp.]|uniref:P-type conjugative transfer protein TrbL n=1 Tax=Phenylobacterium sp. TaxID=1871053 RepID=UPI002E2EC482